MASRYWVGGSATWDSTAGSKWAATSGGAGGQTVPTSSDDVFFDAASGASTITMGSGRTCRSLTMTGFTGTWAGANGMTISGSLTLAAGMTITYTGALTFDATTTGWTITCAGKTLSSILVMGTASGGYWTLQDAMVLANKNLSIRGGTFDTNGQILNLGTGAIDIGGSTTRALKLGASAVSCGVVGAGAQPTNLTFDPGTSTITIVNSVLPGISQGLTTGLTYYNVVIATNTGQTAIIAASNTFNDFKINPGATARFTQGTTQTAASWTISGTAGNLCTLTCAPTGSPAIYYLVKTGGGILSLDYLAYGYASVSGAVWYAGNNSTDNGNNVGWSLRFTNPGNAYADDGSFATAPSTDGIARVSLSGDAGVNFSAELSKTFGASETSEVFGTGASELWGRSWTGDDVDDTSFRVRIAVGDSVATYKTYGFSIVPGQTLTGIEVSVNGKWNGSTFSLDHIKVKIYYGTSVVPVGPGSQAYVSNGRKAGEGSGAGTGVLAFYDNANHWCAVDTGLTVAA